MPEDKDEPRLRDLSDEKDREDYRREMEYYNRRFKEESSFRDYWRRRWRMEGSATLIYIAVLAVLAMIWAIVKVF